MRQIVNRSWHSWHRNEKTNACPSIWLALHAILLLPQFNYKNEMKTWMEWSLDSVERKMLSHFAENNIKIGSVVDTVLTMTRLWRETPSAECRVI